MYASGISATRAGLGTKRSPVMGTMLIDSVPPARTTEACPVAMRSAAMAMDCRPLEQKRFNVMAGT